MSLPMQTMHNPEDRSFIGHPRGLGYIAFAEAWERFSYYGMQALLVLYMVNRLLHPGHIDHIAGFVPFRHLIESFRGPLDVQPLSSTFFGLYTGLVYLTTIGGGLIADRWLGRTLTITIGASLMALGHFLMAFDFSFLLALLCLVSGVGCFKGNLASQVGALYATGDNRRADAFQIYYIFINAGVIISPLIAGTLGEVYGWHWGFGAAGVGMLIGLTIYLSGRKYLPPHSPVVAEKEASADHTPKTKLTRRDKIAIPVVIGAALAARSGEQVSIGWLIAFHVLNSAGFANVFPVSLALYARVAPAALSATIIGVYYLAFFAGNNLVGWIGGFLEKMPATQFWLLHAALAGIAGVTFLLAGKLFGHLLAPGNSATS